MSKTQVSSRCTQPVRQFKRKTPGATFQGIRTGAGSELKSFAEEKNGYRHTSERSYQQYYRPACQP
jgi:hypothetical protein